MTALTITKASVAYQEGPIAGDQIAGEAFDAGDCVYLKQADSRWYKAQNDGTTAEAGEAGTGMALFTADAAGARGTIAKPGAIVTIGTGTAGVTYCVGATYGDYVPDADVSGAKKTIVGVGIGSNKLLLCHVYNAGAVVA